MNTSNPVLGAEAFKGWERVSKESEVMTVQGSIYKTAISLLLVLLTAGWTWSLYAKSGNPASVTIWIWVGLIGGLILALVTTFKKTWSPFTTPLYALFEGLFLGSISAIFNASFPGIVFQAVSLTFLTLACLLFAYQTGMVQATEKFKLGVVAATGGIALLYVISIILGFFGITVPYIYGNGIVGILFSVVVVTIAALNLVIDFDFIEKASRIGAPKYMEWYGAFALMVTLIWLYLEILRLISKVRSNK